MIKKKVYVIIALVLTKERWVLFVIAVVIICVLLTIILFLTFIAIYQIKMAGMEVHDFVSFIKANDTLNKLYAFSVKYEQLTPQQQVLFLQEADTIFDAFGKVPDALWEEDYQKYMEILTKYKDIKIKRWESQDE